MKEFSDFGAFARYLATLPALHNIAMHKASELSAKLVQDTAQGKMGNYQPRSGPFNKWSELADVTKQQRVELGFTENDPLLRTGALRDSITHEIDTLPPFITVAAIGSDSDIAVDQELGTNRIPPRPFLGPAMYENEQAIIHIVMDANADILEGKGLR